MGGERQGPKGGRYVGGFLQLFDWNAKSRKKLFPSKSDLPEHPKQGKQSDGNFPRIRMVDEDEIGVAVSIKGSDYSCASSVTDEEGYGTRAPGVVARLMGLDCLPTSNASEPYSSPFTDIQSLREAPFDLHFSYQEHPLVSSGNFLEGLPRNIVEPKHKKSIIRPIEKFQTEMLPPRSAKSIPITHHKLLSPIKKPGFVPSKDVARIMEAAAKIIDPGPQASPRAKISSTGSSSVPLKVRELKEKMEASQRLPRFAEVSHRPVESNAAKSLKGKSLNKSWNGSGITTDEGSASSSTRSNAKSISLAIQAKVNVQRREGMNQNQKNLEGMKDEDSFKLTQSSKTVHRKPSVRNASTVLRQNNQKQNCSIAKENLASKPLSTNNLHGRKVVSGDSSQGRQKNLYKDAGSSRVLSKKSSLEGRDGHKDVSNSGARNVPRKKRSIDGNLQNERTDSVDTMSIGKNEKLSKSNSVADRHFQGTDVVSFTFTTPMMRSMGGLELSKQNEDDESNNSLFGDNRNKKAMLCSDNLKLSSLGYDVGVDSLSVLLEQKLKELSNGIESSRCNFIKAEETSSTARQNAINFCAPGSETGRFYDKNAPLELQMGNDHARMFSSYSSTEPDVPRRRYDLQGGEMDEYSNTKLETRQLYNARNPSPVSILDPSGLTESCNSSDSTESNMTEECKQQSSSGQEMVDSSYLGTIHELETEKDLSDSASSFSSGTVQNSTNWELGYIKDILCNVEMMYKEHASGKTHEIINPHFFDHLERKRGSLKLSSCKDEFMLERKALFDCVSECLEWRCQLYVGGGLKAWAKGVSMVTKKDRLAEEVYKEIQVWRSMRNNMVDELVDKDMSVQQGRWLDFEADEFELAVDIEDQLLDSLVDDMVADILPFSRLSSNAAFLLM